MTPHAGRPLTVVMYHYVRPLRRTRYPAIRGRDLDDFNGQLDHLEANYTLLSVDDVVDAIRSGEALPDRAALLTFDDGFSDHFQYVTPILVDRGLTGAFYPPSCAVLRRRLLDVHRIHFVLASGVPPERLAQRISDEITAEFGSITATEHWESPAQPNRFDTAEVIFVKRMLQVALPAPMRTRLVADLFDEYVSVDETAFAEELYCSDDQLRMMCSAGMHIGSHGHDHPWLTSLDADGQRADLTHSIEFLRDIAKGAETPLTICYPHGDFDDVTLEVASSLGFEFGFTTDVRVADLDRDDPLRLPRLDTNDLPTSR